MLGPVAYNQSAKTHTKSGKSDKSKVLDEKSSSTGPACGKVVEEKKRDAEKRSLDKLRLHADARHGTSAKHLCHTCGFVCRAPSVFHRHVATHGGGGAHSCHACAFTSRTPAALLRHHARDHVPRQQHPLSADDDDVERFWRYESAHAQPYRCLVCTYACCFKHNVRLHVKRHFNIREHACTRCDKRFVSSAAAHAHERQTHYKLHAYVCCYCDFSSPYWRTVDQHKKRRHGGGQAVQVAETPQSTD
ncbi:PREDICTED: transcriptional repressor CTCFL-like [Priapulus caudatus]|uniref:Transcriptional repressor CTCFL-like n=1 Tax=Priapulus caudatus TaxID=37621 RepID=A0ABM1EUY4_PRICU|nr:PREDICTED: transcriptional repressor CTCFL-like [Priapulus caudatus]